MVKCNTEQNYHASQKYRNRTGKKRMIHAPKQWIAKKKNKYKTFAHIKKNKKGNIKIVCA